MIILLLLAQLTATQILPRTELSPGALAIDPATSKPLTVATICATKWGLDDRHVDFPMKRLVLERYGHTWTEYQNERRGPMGRLPKFEIDHVIPRELGGADSVLNLWPQPWPDAHKKDLEENRLHRAVCAGTVTLEDAQEQMRRWPQ